GASRGRVIRQLVTESVLLSCLGGALGIVVALWTQSWVSARLNSAPIAFGVAPSLNWQVVGMAVGLSLLTGLVFGLAPALKTMQVPIVRGRAITSEDERPGGAPVAVVDETYVRLYLGGVDPIGQYLRIPGEARFKDVQIAVVGVARNTRIGALTGEPDGTVY